jgi:hypothetical protein
LLAQAVPYERGVSAAAINRSGIGSADCMKDLTVIALEDDEAVPLFRLLGGHRPDAHEFASNHALEKARAWIELGEDAVSYRGFSAFQERWQAESLAERLNARLSRKGLPPRWTHVVAIQVLGAFGHCLARTRSEGHHCVWGEPETFVSTATGLQPIPFPEA